MKKFAALFAAAVLAAGANAATVSFSDTIAATTTNWSDALTLGKFDSSLGTLTGVSFSYGGSVSSVFRGESLDAAASNVTLTASGDLAFGGPISDTLSVSGSKGVTLGAFDGAIDFGGTSGFGPETVDGTDSASLALNSALWAMVTGVGTYDISVVATGLSNASGAGNLLTQINTQAGAEITVTYTYDVPTTNVPEPASLALVGLALAGVAAARRKA